MDTTNKTYAEIQQMIAELKAQADEQIQNERNAVLMEIRRLAASVDLNIEIIDDNTETSKSKRISSPVTPKYRNPENESETWSGRGLKPKWLTAKLNSGKNLEDFLI